MRLKDQVKEHDQEFEKRHMEVLEFIEEEDQTTLDAEEKVFDEHVNRVSDIMERPEKLEDLGAATEPVRPHVSTDPKEAASGWMRNQKCLKYLKTSLDKAKAMIRLLEPTPALDICLVEKMKKDVDMFTNKLSDIVEDILSLPENDTASLNEATSMEDELGSMTLKLIRLNRDRERRDRRTTDEASASPGVRLPKISIPTFDGKILSWKSFWEQFDATIHSKAGLIDIEKLTYLQDALKDSLARFMSQGLTRTSENYEESIKCLKERYDRPRLVQEEHIHSIVDAVPVKNGSDKELRRLYDAATQHYRALKAAKSDSFDTVLTVILQQKLDEKSRLKWAELAVNTKLFHHALSS